MRDPQHQGSPGFLTPPRNLHYHQQALTFSIRHVYNWYARCSRYAAPHTQHAHSVEASLLCRSGFARRTISWGSGRGIFVECTPPPPSPRTACPVVSPVSKKKRASDELSTNQTCALTIAHLNWMFKTYVSESRQRYEKVVSQNKLNVRFSFPFLAALWSVGMWLI